MAQTAKSCTGTVVISADSSNLSEMEMKIKSALSVTNHAIETIYGGMTIEESLTNIIGGLQEYNIDGYEEHNARFRKELSKFQLSKTQVFYLLHGMMSQSSVDYIKNKILSTDPKDLTKKVS
jgi:hypothetical protein